VVPLDPGEKLGRLFANIGFAHLGTDPVAVVPILLAAALDAGRGAAKVGHTVIEQQPEQIVPGGMGSGGVAIEGHVQHFSDALNIWACSTASKIVEQACASMLRRSPSSSRSNTSM
jgi:hypothetical protein